MPLTPEEEGFNEIFGEPEPPITKEEARRLWDRVVSLNDRLVGSKVSFADHGGDQLRIDATLKRIYQRADGAVVLEVHGATWVCEGETRTPEELTPQPCPHSQLAVDPSWDSPKILEERNRILQIVLPGLCEIPYFTIGFIWPPK